MSRAILIVDHGSRRAEANAQLDAVARDVRERDPGAIVEIAHMELAPPSIADGLAACVAAGASDVVVHPFFLGPGNHTQNDIPRLVAEAAANHPEVKVRISGPLGPHPKLVDILLERVEEASRTR